MIPIYWINLDECVDRKEYMDKIFTSQNIPNERVQAIRYVKPVVGCALSHIKAIHKAWVDGNELALISEDDADFSNAYRIFTIINNVLTTLPPQISADWDIIQIQYTEPHFSKALSNYIHEYLRYSGESTELQNRLIKGYLYGSVCYLINRRGMEKLLDTMVKIDKNDISKYTITANFDHPRAGAEETIYRYVNTYMTVFPIVNYLSTESTINTLEYYTLANEKNRIITDSNIELLPLDSYKIISNKNIYELEYHLHWFNGGKEEVEEVINDIFDKH